jgi:hypothetical protein
VLTRYIVIKCELDAKSLQTSVGALEGSQFRAATRMLAAVACGALGQSADTLVRDGDCEVDDADVVTHRYEMAPVDQVPVEDSSAVKRVCSLHGLVTEKQSSVRVASEERGEGKERTGLPAGERCPPAGQSSTRAGGSRWVFRQLWQCRSRSTSERRFLEGL